MRKFQVEHDLHSSALHKIQEPERSGNGNKTEKEILTSRRAPTRSVVTGSSFRPFTSATCGANNSVERKMSNTWANRKEKKDIVER